MFFYQWHGHTRIKRKIWVLPTGVEPTTLRLVLRMLYHWAMHEPELRTCLWTCLDRFLDRHYISAWCWKSNLRRQHHYSYCWSCRVIVRMRVVLKMTVDGDSDKQPFHLALMMTSAQVVETSVTVTDNSPFQDYPHPDDHTTRSTVIPGFKPFTVLPLL